MPPLSLVPETVPLLCQLVIAGTATLYLLSLPRRTRATRWLTAMLGFGAAGWLGYLASTLAPAGGAWELRSNLVLYAGVFLSMLSGVQAAYTFLAAPYRHERRVALAVSAVAAVALLAPTLWAIARADVPLASALLAPYGVVLVLGAVWGIAVNLRQARRLRRLASRETVRRGARLRASQAHHAFVALAAINLAMALVNAAATCGLLPVGVLQVGTLLGQIAVSVGLIVLVINHAPEPTTVQAKLVGLTLASVLAVLGVSALVTLRPAELARAAGNVVPDRVLLRFEPDPGGGYAVEQRRPSATSTLGAVRAVAPEASGDASGGRAVALPFAFPFAGEALGSVQARCIPVLLLAAPEAAPGGSPEAALFAFAGPGSLGGEECVRVELTPERATFEWRGHDLSGREARHSASLFPDGAFEIAYSGARSHPTLGAMGFRMRGDAPYVQATLAEGLPRTVPAGTGLMDRYGPRYRAAAHERTRPLAWLVFGAAAFVLLGYPLFLRRSVLNPLRNLLGGVERVQRGDRGARVRATSADEFGLLARAFNGMAGSVETAEDRLRAYADNLEAMVAERTADLEAAQARLLHTETMARLGELTAGIAHELKNPLNFVNNFAALSTEAVGELREAMASGDAETAAECLDDLATGADRILAHGTRADAIVRAMQLHARGTASGERAPADLNALLRLAAEKASREHPDLPPVALHLSDDAGEVPVAPEAIVQAVLNVLDNAMRATREAAPQEASGEATRPVELRSRRSAEGVEILVRDRGPGIDEGVRGRIFQPFVTTRPTGEGVGLGLSLAHGIVVDAHGGRMEARPEPDGGTTFAIALPA